MSNPDDAAAQSGEKVTFADKVATAISGTTQDDNGKDILPEGLDESVTYAANAELRRRHTQGEFAKSKQSLTASEAENGELRKLVVPQLNLSVEKLEELEDLSTSDPKAWRVEMNRLEAEAKTASDKDLDKISLSASQAAEVERRTQVLDDFRTANPGLKLDNEVLANNIPPRIKDKLEKGEVTFEEFLSEAKVFLAKGKAVGDGTSTEEEPDLNDVGGGDKATSNAVAEDIRKSYDKEIY